jgi:hypothetical protein
VIYHNQIPSSNYVEFPAALVDKVARAHKLKNRIEVQPPTLSLITIILRTRASNFVNLMVQSVTAKSLSTVIRWVAVESLIEEIENKPISSQINSRFSLAGWFNN